MGCKLIRVFYAIATKDAPVSYGRSTAAGTVTYRMAPAIKKPLDAGFAVPIFRGNRYWMPSQPVKHPVRREIDK